MRIACAVSGKAQVTGRNERVLDMFAGVGPFSLLIARQADAEAVVAVDKNPDAVKYLKRNIALNRISNVEPHLGDAAELVERLACDRGRFQRIIMNFPSGPDPFFGAALRVLDESGIIHFYRVTGHTETEQVKTFLTTAASSCNRVIDSINVREVRTYSTTSSHYAFDVHVL